MSLDKLDMIAGAADDGVHAIDNPGVEAPQPEAAPAGPDYLGEATMIVDVCTAIVVGMVPPAATIWTPEVKGRVSMAMAPVLEKYNFTVGDIPPELGLAVALVPPMLQTYKLYVEVAKAARAKQKERTFDAPTMPTSDGAAEAAADSVAA